MSTSISLIVPVLNEADSIRALIDSIARQTLQPDEIIFVDGGSTDETISIIEEAARQDPRIKLIETGGATPGKGRNVGIAAAGHEWIALTDAGIEPEDNWLAELCTASADVDIVYGNYAPKIRNSFDKSALIAYVPPKRAGIRGKSIASYLMKKAVWAQVGGFPDLRAAEDLIFMERAEAAGFGTAEAPNGLVHWHLRPDWTSTFAKFTLYSRHNVWAGRQWDWHYGVAKQYLGLVPFVILAIWHSLWWLLAVPAWLAARTAKRIVSHRYEFSWKPLIDPFTVARVAGLILVIDAATFLGWLQALVGCRDRVMDQLRGD
ncbi:MAG: glycosyltransferase [Pyrinomonadaceae bacterium]